MLMKHKEGNFKGHKGVDIYYQCWLPMDAQKAVILISHGFGEHSARYYNLANYFIPKRYAIYAMDHRGHGKSGGERVRVDDFFDYIRDVKSFFDIVREENQGSKVFLLGHSLGALISLIYTVEYQDDLAGLITSGAGSPRPTDPPLPLPAPGEGISTSILSRDPAVIEDYLNDPLVYKGPIPQTLARIRNGMMSKLPELLPRINIPVLVMAGTGVTDAARSQVVYEFLGSKDKTIKLYDGLLHEIFKEPEQLQVMADLEEWLEAHL
jgi:acylglycerol lipase